MEKELVKARQKYLDSQLDEKTIANNHKEEIKTVKRKLELDSYKPALTKEFMTMTTDIYIKNLKKHILDATAKGENSAYIKTMDAYSFSFKRFKTQWSLTASDIDFVKQLIIDIKLIEIIKDKLELSGSLALFIFYKSDSEHPNVIHLGIHWGDCY